jgi:hypothetical protein
MNIKDLLYVVLFLPLQVYAPTNPSFQSVVVDGYINAIISHALRREKISVSPILYEELVKSLGNFRLGVEGLRVLLQKE